MKPTYDELAKALKVMMFRQLRDREETKNSYYLYTSEFAREEPCPGWKLRWLTEGVLVLCRANEDEVLA